MAGLVPAIHVGPSAQKDVDARVKPGHDGGDMGALQLALGVSREISRALALELPGWAEAPEILRGDGFQRIRRDAEAFEREARILCRL